MKRNILYLLLLAASMAVGQTTPNWYDNDMRRSFYPAGQYFIGFAEGNRRNGESLEIATQRLKDAARTEAVSTIRVHVQNTTVNHSLSQTLRTMEGTFRQSAREFESTTTTSVDMQIPGLQVEAWTNPANGNIAAFAYVKKVTLIRQLEKTIIVVLTKIETSLDQVDQLIANGQKMQARDVASKTLPQFAEVDEAQKTLAAVDENADEESLQLQETRDLQRRLIAFVTQLKNGINIYLQCTADMFGTNYGALKSEIQGELSKLGCTFVSSPDESDWAVYVKAPARQYNKADFGGTSSYFSYVDATITIDKTTTGQRIFEDQISEKGGHTHNFEQAARDAYKHISPKISALIKEQIQQYRYFVPTK
ncbi:MAG: hypothetical protein IJT12_00115 [Paludibacteraceae bacterium]|nr:hypothetical protein [Paludibacteraceae bacterium]